MSLAAVSSVTRATEDGIVLPHLFMELPLTPKTNGYGAGAALVAAQLRSGHELRHLEPGFPDTDRLEDQEDLIGDFTDAAEAIIVTIHAQDVVNNVF